MARKAKTKPFASSPIDDLPTRQRTILAAAFEVMMEQGYARASTLDIATRARVSKRELYTLFASKRGILEALISATANRMQVPLQPHDVVDRESLVGALSRYGTTVLEELTHPAVLAINRLAVTEADRTADLGRVLESQGREPNRRALAQLFARAQAAGVVGAGDPLRMGGQFYALLWGDLMLRLLLGVEQVPNAREIRQRATAATDAVLALNPP
jgi:AcrR family transcriptional regulator